MGRDGEQIGEISGISFEIKNYVSPNLLLLVKNSKLSSIPFNSESIIKFLSCHRASQMVLVLKNLPAGARDIRDMDSIPGSGRFPGEGNSNPLQYSCLENPIDRGTWWATVHGVAESDTAEVTWHIAHLSLEVC